MQVKILSGLPGSGKSTLWQREFPQATVVSADGFMREKAKLKGLDYDNNGEGFDPALLPAAHQNCFSRFLCALETQHELIVVDNTNLSAWEISPYMLAAETYGFGVEIIRVSCDPETAQRRNIHGVPAAAFESMAAAFEKRDVLPWWNVRSA